MDDETNALLYMAGPANWRHAIAPTRINMGNNTIITNINTALQGAQGPRATEFNLNALTGLQAAANILANKIADTIYIANALDIFREACITANKLDKEATVPHPAFQPSFKKAMTATRILKAATQGVNMPMLAATAIQALITHIPTTTSKTPSTPSESA